MKCPLIAAFLFSLSAFADGGEGRVIHHDGGSLVFNSSGVLTIAANDVAVSRFVYDGDRRVTAADMLFGTNYFAFAFLRDAGGLVTNLVCGESLCVTKSYDLRGRLTSLRDGHGHEWTFRYDAEDRLVGGAAPDGVNRSLAYDGCGRVTEWSVGSLAGRTITRDAAGRRIRDDVTAGPMPIPSSNRLAENVFDASDRLVSASVKEDGVTFSESYLYDSNGALTNILADGASEFNAFYSAGRLVSLGTNGWHCAYDALGNRVRMGDRIFVPDYDDPLKRPLLECAADGSGIRRYLWGPTGLLGFVDADGALTVAHSDEQGSVIALTDIDGNVLFRANYGPYGEDWGSSGFNPTPFFWLGGLGVMKANPDSLIPDPLSLIPSPSSLYLTRHRLYSPVLRRFLSADPLGFAGGANVYAYADGNPLAYVDPLGLCAEDVGFLSYLGDSAEQVLLGNFTDKVTGLGTAGEVAAGVFGIDLLMDVRDIGYDLTHWENSWSHAGQTGIDIIGIIPLVGVLKYGDEVGTLWKSTNRLANKQVDSVAREFGIRGVERRNFGKYIDSMKDDVGRGGADNFTYQQLREIAEEFLRYGKH